MPDRLLDPIDVLLVEGAPAFERVRNRKCLVVVDHQRDGVTDPLAYRVHGGEIIFERRVAKPQLHSAETMGKQFLRFVSDLVWSHQPEPAADEAEKLLAHGFR